MPLMMPNNLEMWFSEKGNVYFENSEEVGGGVGGGVVPVDINNANVKMLVTNICDERITKIDQCVIKIGIHCNAIQK